MAEKADSRGKLFVISGPSGAGKGTICNELMSQAEPDELCLSISVTTREPRKGEKDGVNYYFISEDEFEDLKENDGLLEFAEVYGHHYGTPKQKVIDKLEAGIQRAGAVTTMLEQGMTPEDILGQVCGELGVVFMETTPVSYKCYCSRERVTSALISLGRKELTEIKEENKTFPVGCQFCSEVYEFTPEDIDELLKNI
jgi:guanylate kinase